MEEIVNENTSSRNKAPEVKMQVWLSDEELERIFSSRYWNDEEKEREKGWSANGNGKEIIEYLQEKTTSHEEFQSVIRLAESMGLPVKGTGIDMAAGIGWAAALLSKIPEVDEIYAMEISKHRLLKIAPEVFVLFNAEKRKIVQVIGSFYDIKLPDSSVDFCFMSQAFHHANEPERLLAAIRRVLKPSGFLMIIGEKPITRIAYLKKYIKNVIKMLMPWQTFRNGPVYKLIPDFNELFVPDMELGDHYYRISDYDLIFYGAGFELHVNKTSKFTTFLAVKAHRQPTLDNVNFNKDQ